MTEKRYVNIYKSPENLYVPQLPVIIEEGTLIYDIEAEQAFIQLKIKSIVNRPLDYVKVMIQTKDEKGANNDQPILYTYENLDINRNQEFGTKEQIAVREIYTTKTFRMTVLEVRFSDGTLFKNTTHDLHPIVFEDGKYEDLWKCTCGNINHKEETECFVCHKDTLEGSLEKQAEVYKKAGYLKNIKNEESLRKAYELFISLKGYENSDSEAEECAKQIKEIEQKRVEYRNEALYHEAKRLENSENVEDLSRAIEICGKLESWKDSNERLKELNLKIEEIEARKEAEEAERIRRNKKKMMIGGGIFCIALVLAIFVYTIIIPSNKYKQALALVDEGKHYEAYEIFNSLKDYKDSVEQANKAYENSSAGKYEEAIALMNVGDYEEAIIAFEFLGDYKESVAYLTECRYNQAIDLMGKKSMKKPCRYLKP